MEEGFRQHDQDSTRLTRADGRHDFPRLLVPLQQRADLRRLRTRGSAAEPAWDHHGVEQGVLREVSHRLVRLQEDFAAAFNHVGAFHAR